MQLPESNTAVQVRLTEGERGSLEDWRRAQEKIPSLSEALREAIRRLVTPRVGASPMSKTVR
jgi:hypothetical protein